MTRRTRAACLLVAALVAVPGAAQAAPKKDDSGNRKKFSAAYAGENVSCAEGATCTVESSAARSGLLASSSSYERTSPSSNKSEAAVGYGSHIAAVTVPAGATAVTVTATWRLDDVRVHATAESGTTYGLVYAGMDIQCESCRTTTETHRTVRRVHDTPSQLSSSEGTDGPQTLTLSVRVEGEIPQQLSVVPTVGTSAGGYPECVLISLCENHAGTSSATFSGTLLSLEVTG